MKSNIDNLYKTRNEITNFIIELNHKLSNKDITPEQREEEIKRKLCGKDPQQVIKFINNKIESHEQKEEKERKKKVIMSTAAISIIILSLIGVLTFDTGDSPTANVIKNGVAGVTENNNLKCTQRTNTASGLGPHIVSVSCKDKEVMTGGGCYTNKEVTVASNHPLNENTWRCQYNERNEYDVTSYAICCE